MLTRAGLDILNLLKKGQELLKEFQQELGNPACYLRFQKNVQLLLGAQNMTLTVLAAKMDRDLGDMSKLCSGKCVTRFQRLKPDFFQKMGEVLGVSGYTLLFVDLRKSFFEMVSNLEKPST